MRVLIPEDIFKPKANNSGGILAKRVHDDTPDNVSYDYNDTALTTEACGLSCLQSPLPTVWWMTFPDTSRFSTAKTPTAGEKPSWKVLSLT